MKDMIKTWVPEMLWNGGRETYDALRRMKNIPEAYFSEYRRESITAMDALKNKHKGERCFILGNGPSLKETDLSKLRNEKTFGMNRIYLGFPDIGFETTYYVCANDLVVEQSHEDIQRLSMPRFVTTRARQWLQPEDGLNFLYTTYTGACFAKDITKRMWEGATVTYVALQIAYYLGFQTVILIGVDHSFVAKGKPNETIVSQGDDPNHFLSTYFGNGFRWQVPDLDTSERSYAMARAIYEADGRQVLDATVGGKLQIFPKVPYEELF